MEDNKFYDKYFNPDDMKSGFNDMYIERNKHIKALRERVSKYGFSENEMNKLFEIVTKAEFDIEKLKRDFNSKKYNYDILEKFKKDIIAIQLKMRDDFNAKLKEMIEKKYGKEGYVPPKPTPQPTQKVRKKRRYNPYDLDFFLSQMDDNNNSSTNFFDA